MSRFARRVYLHLAVIAGIWVGAAFWGLDPRIAWSLGVLFALSAVMTIHSEVGRQCRRGVSFEYDANTYCILPTGHMGDCGDKHGNRSSRDPSITESKERTHV